MARNIISKRFVALALVLFAFATMLLTGGMVSAYANEEVEGDINGGYIDFHGIKLNPNTELEAYGLKVNLKNYAFYGVSFREGKSSRFKKESVIILTFNNLKYYDTETGKEYIFRFMINTTLDCPSSIPFSDSNVYFTENLEISLTNNHYKYFKKLEESGDLDFTDINLQTLNGYKIYQYQDSFLGHLFGKSVYSFNFETELTSYNVPVAVVDPDDEDFDIDFGNGGTNITQKDEDPYSGAVGAEDLFNFGAFLKNLFFEKQTGGMLALQIVAWLVAVYLVAFVFTFLASLHSTLNKISHFGLKK